MKQLLFASAFALAVSSGAYAEGDPATAGGSTTTTGQPASAAATKLSQAECDAVWKQANPANAATITEAQYKQYVSDFKAANSDNNETLDQKEFSQACSNGLVKGSSATSISK